MFNTHLSSFDLDENSTLLPTLKSINIQNASFDGQHLTQSLVAMNQLMKDLERIRDSDTVVEYYIC